MTDALRAKSGRPRGFVRPITDELGSKFGEGGKEGETEVYFGTASHGSQREPSSF